MAFVRECDVCEIWYGVASDRVHYTIDVCPDCRKILGLAPFGSSATEQRHAFLRLFVRIVKEKGDRIAK